MKSITSQVRQKISAFTEKTQGMLQLKGPRQYVVGQAPWVIHTGAVGGPLCRFMNLPITSDLQTLVFKGWRRRAYEYELSRGPPDPRNPSKSTV